MTRAARLLAVIVAAGLLYAGCAAVLLAGGAAAGAGTVLYVRGALEATYDQPYDVVWQASLDGIKSLGLRPTKRDKGPAKGVIKTRRLDDKPVTIIVSPLTQKTTKVSIRVGTFGDEVSSTEILEAIEAKL